MRVAQNSDPNACTGVGVEPVPQLRQRVKAHPLARLGDLQTKMRVAELSPLEETELKALEDTYVNPRRVAPVEPSRLRTYCFFAGCVLVPYIFWRVVLR